VGCGVVPRRLSAQACENGYGNNWVIAAVVVELPFTSHPVALPVLAKLVIKGTTSASGCGWPAAWRRCWPRRCLAAVSTSWQMPPTPGTR
jgi:hypothetical protein